MHLKVLLVFFLICCDTLLIFFHISTRAGTQMQIPLVKMAGALQTTLLIRMAIVLLYTDLMPMLVLTPNSCAIQCYRLRIVALTTHAFRNDSRGVGDILRSGFLASKW